MKVMGLKLPRSKSMLGLKDSRIKDREKLRHSIVRKVLTSKTGSEGQVGSSCKVLFSPVAQERICALSAAVMRP